MIIDLNINDWTLEHDRKVRNIIRTTSVEYTNFYKERFPEDILVVGENWLYIGEVKPLSLDVPDKDYGNGVTLAFSRAINIKPIDVFFMTKYVPLTQIFNDFKKYFEKVESAIFPLSEQRNHEAKQLGLVYQHQDDWYTVQRDDEKLIKVFPLTPEKQTIYFMKIGDKSVGYTSLKRQIDV